MVYIKSWTEYQTQAEKLYEQQPDRTRYCVKYRAADSSLVLKVTDDNLCLKYKTQSSIMLNRFEAFNLSMMSKMQNRRPQPPQPAIAATLRPGTGAQLAPVTADVIMADATSTASQGAGGGGPSGASPAGAAKKKKPKKKK